MGLVQNDQICLDVDPRMHGIIELVSQDLGGADDHRGRGILFPIPGQNPALSGAELAGENLIDGIGKGLERGGIPDLHVFGQEILDRLHGDPSLSGACGRTDQNVTGLESLKGFKLKGIRLKGLCFREADLAENGSELRVYPGIFIF